MLQMLIGTNVPFMKFRRYTYMFSGALALATAIWLVMHGGPRYSVDFTGGLLLQIRTSQALHADQIRQALDAGGIHGVELQQMTGENRNEYLIRSQVLPPGQDLFSMVKRAVESHNAGTTVELRRAEVVGPKVGSELRTKAIWAILGSLA